MDTKREVNGKQESSAHVETNWLTNLLLNKEDGTPKGGIFGLNQYREKDKSVGRSDVEMKFKPIVKEHSNDGLSVVDSPLSTSVEENAQDEANKKGSMPVTILLDPMFKSKSGKFGRVFKGDMEILGKGSQPVCVKAGNYDTKDEEKLAALTTEADHHKCISHERDMRKGSSLGGTDDLQIGHATIVEWLACFEFNGNITIIMEWAGESNLAEFRASEDFQRGSPKKRLTYIKGIVCKSLSGLHYLDSLGFCHGDISPKNIMWNPKSEKLKLIDYGLSVKHENRDEFNCVTKGTISYASKEVLDTEKHMRFKSDVWSLAGCIYYVIIGERPWSFLTSQHHKDILEAMNGDCKCGCAEMPLICQVRKVTWMCPHVLEALKQMFIVNHVDRLEISSILEAWRQINEFLPGQHSKDAISNQQTYHDITVSATSPIDDDSDMA